MPNIWKTITVVCLVAVITVSSIIAWSKYSRNEPVEISLASAIPPQGQIYVGGNVTNPGYYPFAASDNLGTIIRAAGGDVTTGQLRLTLGQSQDGNQPQKINLNRAEAWLLAALPDIGQTRAQAIISYRQKNGPFRSTNELLKIEGFGATTYDKIKDMVTVVD